MVEKNTDAASPEASKPAESSRKEPPQGQSASIGPSITINGDVTGEENLVVAGVIEGTVNLKDNNLVVSENGRLTANISARIIRVDGEVKGELRGSEQVIISPTGQVSGDIRAPRVVLEDGCQFKGSIDMEHDKQAAAGERGVRTTRLRPGATRPVRPGSDNSSSGPTAIS